MAIWDSNSLCFYATKETYCKNAVWVIVKSRTSMHFNLRKIFDNKLNFLIFILHYNYTVLPQISYLFSKYILRVEGWKQPVYQYIYVQILLKVGK